MIELPTFGSKTAMFDYLMKNQTSLISQKKAITKECDKIGFIMHADNDKTYSSKADSVIGADVNKLFVRSVINATGILDSHNDVHIKGLWKKSIQETKEKYLVEEHDFSFRGIISDEVEAYTKIMSFKSMGYDFDGDTEALIYDSIIHKDRNEYMFEQYAKRRVKNHSVGMRYIKLFMCINSPMYDEAYENWKKYFEYIVANPDEAEEQGFFYAVTEAKDVEGSAVVRGSCPTTPTLITRSEKSEPPSGTLLHTEPSTDTQRLKALQDLLTKF